MVSAFAWSRSILLLAQAFLSCHVTHAKVDSLFTSSVTYCAPPEAILIQEFSIIYFARNQSVSFNISAASVQPNLRVRANILLNVYGMQPVNLTEDFCTVFGNALCPLPMYNFTGSSSIPLPSSINVASKVPGIAYKIPDLEAFAQLTLTDINTNNVVACLQATLSNGWSAHQTAVSFTTGVFAIFALLSATLHSLLPSTPLGAPFIHDISSITSARFVDFILLFQQISMTGLFHLNLPLVYRAFTVNFAWSLGLFPDSRSIQRAIDHMRHLTGGSSLDGVQSPIAFVNRQLSPYNEPIPPGSSPSSFLTSVNAAYMATHQALTTRDSSTDSSAGNGPPATVTTGGSNILPVGIPVFVNTLDISTTNALMSVFFTVLIGAAVGAGILGIMYVALTFAVTRLRGTKWAWADVMHAEFRWFAASSGIRYAMVIIYPVLIFSFFQWTLHDSWLVVCLSVIMLLCTAAALLYPMAHTLLTAQHASIQVLYTTPRLFHTFGVFYTPFRQQRYAFFTVVLAAAVVKSLFIGFAKGNGLIQVISLLLIELVVLVLLCIQKPYRSRGGDVLAVYMAVTRVVAASLMFPFVATLQIKPIPRVAVGFVLIALFSAAVVVMCCNVVFNFGDGLLWRRRRGAGLMMPLETSGSRGLDVEKGTLTVPHDPFGPPAMAPGGQRPKNPTPSTSFSLDPSHSRHTPQMSSAVSPNYTIPSFYTSEDDDDNATYGKAQHTPRSSTQTRSPRLSFFTTSSPPSTPENDQFPSHDKQRRQPQPSGSVSQQ